uniref:centromere-associated protein E isoform X13 n=1 Tax=Gasterosteus aculeatus aculeatus TaxID=481459 RepID=UPI001A993F3F|nr:centromere-associated protein E isoform X13 [Gasterosteus aculeatus aculeatus]
MTEESAVKVCVRVRPLIARESAASESAEPVPLFWKADKKSIHQVDDGNSTKSFVFDRVFTADETTNQLYQDIAKPLVVSTVKGYNGTIFAYGQTSSGKTFTMMGGDRIHGVIPLAVDDVFQTIRNCSKKEFLLRVSYMEIYNETVSDLLVDSCKRKPLEVRETINKNIYVADLTEELVTTTSQVLAWIRKGEENRHYAKTKMNERSSRSHTIFRMILESREIGEPASGEISDGAVIVSHLNLVDLAGSERASQTGAEGTHFKEGVNINRSLFTLSQVIKKLTDESQKGFTNYRDSKLTRILQNSLGGNAKTVIICTITPAALDETLSTLQFACTAKKMKNDPHVTEVSDDGALLKRYRNEIVDLKRRLHEVSSHTHTSATEKEVLSQLLQEKDQLQREQEDRIRNLTRLLVSSSNLVPVRKRPKRRVTWGGKMARLPAHDGSPSGLSSAETFTRKGKADRSCMSALCEEEEDFDSRWEIADEPSYEMDMSQSSVTVRSFEDSPKDFMSPDGGCNLSGKVSNLEMQLEIETRQTEEARTKVETLDAVVAELQLQLQTEARQTQEALEKMQTAEQRAGEVELQLQLHTEAQQKQEANEEVELLKLRVADLEKQLEEQSHTPSDADEQMKKEFAETIQLCETLAKEKDDATTERDYLKEELGMFMEEIKRLEEEKATLSKEKEEKREMDEFVSLEEEFRKEHESELQNEIAKLKSDLVSSELQRLELNNKIETLSKELQSKTEFAEELQSLSGKDLVKEVAALRRSLDDAEGLSRDTKKEWAHLRSKNIAVEEMNVNLNAGYEKLDAELTRLRSQLEAEKSRFKSMQSDLQKELNVAFDENTKLTTLLDGNVPKNLIDSLELERTAARLSRELTSSQEAEGSLRAQLEELSSLRTLPDQLNELMQELQHVRTEKGALLSQQRSAAEETEKLLSAVACLTAERDQLTTDLQEHVEEAAETQLLLQSLQDELQEQTRQNSNVVELAKQKEFESDQHMQSLSEELQRVRAEKDALLSEQRSCAEEAEKLLSSITSLTAERDQLQTDLQENVEMMIENQEELRTALEKNRKQKAQIKLLEAAQQEPEDSASETAAQREQLQTLMIENQEELRASQEKIRLLQDEIDELRSQKAEPEGDAEIELQIQRLTEKLQLVEAERDGLLSEKDSILQTSTEETEKLLCRVTSLSEERDQLLETLEGVRGEERQLRAQLEDKMETMQTETRTLSEKLQLLEAERDGLLSEKDSILQTSTEETEKLLCRVTSLSEERDQLLETLEGVRGEERQLRAQLEDKMETMQTERKELLALAEQENQMEGDLQSATEMTEASQSLLQSQENMEQERLQERKAQLEQQVAETESLLSSLQEELREQRESGLDRQSLVEQLESVRADRDALSLKMSTCQTSTEETEKLLCRVTSLSEERDQLLETLQGVRGEKQQLRAELEDKMETMQMETRTLSEKLQLLEAERDGLLSEKDSILQTSTEETEKLLCRVTSLSEERDQLLETLEGVRGEERQLRAQLEDKMETMQTEITQLEASLQTVTEQKRELDAELQRSGNETRTLSEKLQHVEAERDGLLSEKDSILQTSTEETEKLLCRVTSLSEERDQLLETLEGVRGEERQLRAQLEDKMETISAIQEQLSEQAQLNSERETELQQTVQQLQLIREGRTSAQVEAGASQQILCDGNLNISALREQLGAMDQSCGGSEETAAALRDSDALLQESCGRFETFIDLFPKYKPHQRLSSTPEPGLDAYNTVRQQQLLMAQALGDIRVQLLARAQGYKSQFENLAKTDSAIFEERRLQDSLLSRAGTPRHSARDEDLGVLWGGRQAELLAKRQLCLQKMSHVLRRLQTKRDLYSSEVSEEVQVRTSFKEQLKALNPIQPQNFGKMDSILSGEVELRSAMAHRRTAALQGVIEEHNSLSEELKLQEARADSLLREEKEKTAALLQVLKDNKQLVLQLRQTEEKVAALRVQIRQLEEAQLKASSRVSNHKEATQLLQTELQDSRAQVEEQHGTIRTLKAKLRQSEENASPSAVELEKLRAKLFKMEVELSSASDGHEREIQKMSTVLKEKEESVRKLKETLRKSQQEGEDSFLQGEELHARLINPRGLVIQTSILLEKTKLEEEVKQLRLKITELESLVSSHQEEIGKWKGRAMKLKVMRKVEVDKTVSPSNPTKRPLSVSSDTSNLLGSPRKVLVTPRKALDSPRKALDSPRKVRDSPRKVRDSPRKARDSPRKARDSPRKARDSPVTSFLDYPKSSFFNGGEGSELLSRTCPKQFFDNSSLGTDPGVFDAPDRAGAEKDAAAGAERKDWWPQSPKQEEMCKTQ